MALNNLLPLLKEMLPDKLEMFGYIKRNKLITLLLVSHSLLVFFLLFMTEQNMLKENQLIETRREWINGQGAVEKGLILLRKLADCHIELSKTMRLEKEASDKISYMESDYRQLARACEMKPSTAPVQQITPAPKPNQQKVPVRNNALPPRTHPNKEKTDYQDLLEDVWKN